MDGYTLFEMNTRWQYKINKGSSKFPVKMPKSLFNISKYAGCAWIFSPDEGDLTRAYFVYVEENRRSMAEKDECRQRVERF